VSQLMCYVSKLLSAGVSAAMNELRPCTPLSLKVILAQEVVKGLHAVSDSLVRYKAMRMLRGNESALFLSLCQAFIEVCLVFHDRPVVFSLQANITCYNTHEMKLNDSSLHIKPKL
jgi:hypothetical protein